MVYLAELLVVMTDRLKIFRIQQSAMQMNGCRHLVPLYPYHATNYKLRARNVPRTRHKRLDEDASLASQESDGVMFSMH